MFLCSYACWVLFLFCMICNSVICLTLEINRGHIGSKVQINVAFSPESN